LAVVEREEAEKLKQYLEEDKSLPLNKRREMEDEVLDEWLLEDQKAAIAWIQRRELRREIDRRQNLILKQREGVTKKLFERQTQSYMKVLEKHPELNIAAKKKNSWMEVCPRTKPLHQYARTIRNLMPCSITPKDILN
jgi:hypothetical protein